MNANQVKVLWDAYNVPAKRPDGSDSLLAEYVRFITTDACVDLVTSKDLVIVDDGNEMVHAITVNEDMRAQATYPVKIISSSFLNVNCIESVMSRDNFRKFIDSGFFDTIGCSEAKKEFMKKWIDGIRIQAQQQPHATPFHTTTANVIPMHNNHKMRDDGIVGITPGASLAFKTVSAVKTEEEIISTLKDGKSVILTNDITLTKEPLLLNTDASIDLNGHKLASADGKRAIIISGGNIEINNGIIEGIGNDAIYMNSMESENGKPCTLTLGSDVVVTATDCGVLIKGKGAVLNTSAIINATGSYCAIQGNGNKEAGGVTINITGGEITAKDTAIYVPCDDGIVNISGGAKITGYTGIYCKSGHVIINDATIIGNGEKVEYTFNNNGCNPTGDAIVVEACSYPGGIPVVDIIDGTFISMHADAIAYYQQSEDYALAYEKFIKSGTFNTDVSKFIIDGYIQNSDGKVIKA